MSFIRAKEIPPRSGNWYDYEVETIHKGGKVIQKHIRYIGKSSLRLSRSSAYGGIVSPSQNIPTKPERITKMKTPTRQIASAVKISVASATSHLMAVLLASGEGDSVNVEAIPDDLSVLYPEKGIIARANHFQTDRFKSGDLMVTLAPDSFVRSQRLLTLMTQHYGKLSVDVMKELMQDHNDYPDSVCRHGDKTFPPDQQRKSNATIISNLSEKKTYIAWGNPCQNEFTEYKL